MQKVIRIVITIPITLNERTTAKNAISTVVIISRIGFIRSNIPMKDESVSSRARVISPIESCRGEIAD